MALQQVYLITQRRREQWKSINPSYTECIEKQTIWISSISVAHGLPVEAFKSKKRFIGSVKVLNNLWKKGLLDKASDNGETSVVYALKA